MIPCLLTYCIRYTELSLLLDSRLNSKIIFSFIYTIKLEMSIGVSSLTERGGTHNLLLSTMELL